MYRTHKMQLQFVPRSYMSDPAVTGGLLQIRIVTRSFPRIVGFGPGGGAAWKLQNRFGPISYCSGHM
jgi:hypothetical protein